MAKSPSNRRQSVFFWPAARLAGLRQACGLPACFGRRKRRAEPHILLSKATKGCKNAFLGDPSGGEPKVSTSLQPQMLAYARLVPHVYHVLQGIAAYESGPPQGHKSVPTYLPNARSKNGWFYFNSNGSAATRRRAALVRAAINMGISERERAVALSLPRGSIYDPAAGIAP